MATLQEQLETSVSKLNADSDIMHQIVHADWQTVVNTDGGSVKSLAKAIYDLETTYAANAVITISQTNNNDAFNWANRAPNSGYADSAGHTGYSARHYAQKAETAASQLPTNKFDANRDPTVNDDANVGFAAGSNWLNVSSKEAFKCIDSAVGAAVWVTTTLTLDDLGTAAAQNIGTGAGEILILDANANAFAAMPIGVPFPLLDHLDGVVAPSNAGAAKFVKLTAGLSGDGQYNEGLLTDEVDNGLAGPLRVVTAEIAIGPLAGQTIHLLNTEGRYIKPGTSSGTVANDQMQQITGNLSETGRIVTDGGTTSSGAISSTASGSGSVAAGPGSIYYRFMSFDSANSPGARTGDYTDVKHMQATYILRIA